MNASHALPNPQDEAMVWFWKWLAAVALVIAGTLTDQLEASCAAVIVIFVVWEGILTFVRFSRSIWVDMRDSRAEKDILEKESVATLRNLALASTAGCGSLMTIIVMMLRHVHVVDMRRVKDLQLKLARQKWQALMERVDTAAELSSGIGLLFTVVGMQAALKNLATVGPGAGLEDFMAAASVMVSTTLYGLAAMILLHGFSVKGHQAIDRHLAEIDLWAEFVIGQLENDQDTDQNASLL